MLVVKVIKFLNKASAYLKEKATLSCVRKLVTASLRTDEEYDAFHKRLDTAAKLQATLEERAHSRLNSGIAKVNLQRESASKQIELLQSI